MLAGKPAVDVEQLTLLLEIDTAFRDYYWDVAVDVALSVLVEQRYCDIRIWYALDEGYTENSWKWVYVQREMSVNVCDGCWWGHCWCCWGALSLISCA
jgi:hypothetical protein